MSAFEGLYGRGPDLRHRLLYTALLLLAFRSLASIPLVNVDEERMQHLLANNPFVGVVNLFAGGEVLTHFSLVATGIAPYLVALAVASLATWVIPSLRYLRQQGEAGKERVEKYAKLLTIPLAFTFALIVSQYLARQTGLFPGRIRWFTAASFWPSLGIVCLVTLGSLTSTWIVSVIDKKGVGGGSNIVLLAGSSFGFAKQFMGLMNQSANKMMMVQRLSAVGLGALFVIAFGVYLLRSVNKTPIRYAKRTLRTDRRRLQSNEQSFIPFSISAGRMLPVYAAIGCLTALQFTQSIVQSYFGGWLASFVNAITFWVTPTQIWYWLALASLIMLFTYIYNLAAIWPSYLGPDLPLAEQLKRGSGFVPGVRPGEQTQKYFSRKLFLMALPAGLGLILLAVGLPYAFLRLTGQNVTVIVLSVVVTVGAVENLRAELTADVVSESYQGFLGSSNRSRWRRWIVGE